MATQAWPSQPGQASTPGAPPQPPIPGQPPVAVPPNPWGPPGTLPSQNQAPLRATFAAPQGYTPSSVTGFSYNGTTQASVESESPQQSQSSTTAISTGTTQGGPFTSPATVAPPQPPVPGQSPAAGPASPWAPPGTALNQTQVPPRPNFSVPPVYPPSPATTQFSYNGTSQPSSDSESPQQSQSSTAVTSIGTVQAGPLVTPTSSNGQSVPAPVYTASHAPIPAPIPVPAASPNTYSAFRWQAPPPVPPGPPGISISTSTLTPTLSAQPNNGDSTSLAPRSGMTSSSSPASVPAVATSSQHVQQMPYPVYPSGPPLGPPAQAPWLPPPQLGGLHRPPFAPYPGGFPGPFQVPPRPVGLPQAPVPNASQLPSTILCPPGGAPSTKGVSGQSLSNWGPQLPPGVSPPISSAPLHMELPGQLSTNASMSAQGATPLKPNLMDKERQGSENSNKEVQILKHVEADSWTAHKTDAGTIYYYNAVTGESTYEKPSGFKGEAEKVTAQPTPVAWEKLTGTDWALVTTNDSKKYFYNTKNQATSWQVPQEVAELRKKQMQEASTKATAISGQNAIISSDKGPISFSLNVPAAITGGRESASHKVPATAMGSSALDLIKRKLQDSGAPVTTSSLPTTGSGSGVTNTNGSIMTEVSGKNQQSESNKEKLKGSVVDGNMSDSSSDSEDEDTGPTKEERILQFKEMLKEKGVAPFSKWEKELPKIIFDPRFKAIPSYTERRSIFEHYVRTRADEERKEKRAAQKAAIEGFKQLLEEASEDITYKTDYETFAKIWGHDPRFEGLDRKERETLLNDRVLPLRKAVEERVKAIHAAAVASFKAMLNDKGDINTSSRWSRVKDSLRSDPRYKAVKHEDREALFNEYVSELRAAEQEAERAAKAKREEEEKLKEREREMRKRKEREEQEMERVRVKARRKDAVTAYQALLTERIKDAEASWTESRPKLEKDPLGRATNPELDVADRERLFREHVNGLYERCVREFRSLLADVINVDITTKHLEDGKNILTSWSEAKRLLKPDPRYARMPRRDRELWWRRYAEDVQRRLKLTSADRKEDRASTDDGNKISSSDAAKRSPGARKSQTRR